MAKQYAAPDKEILEAALHGLETQREKLDGQIAQVRAMLGTRKPGRPAKTASLAAAVSGVVASSGRAKRVLSRDARNRIAAAQKKRWAAFRKTQT